ncbi:MAG: IclR family transcriptional regulator [Lacipirellulaceae bacterium]
MAKKRTTKTSYEVPALEKGLDILELLAVHEAGLTQQQIAEYLGRSLSQLYRMLNCLLKRGYVQKATSDDRYRLSAKLFVLAHQYPPTHRLHETAMPILRGLAQQIEQSCHLGVPDEGFLLIMSQVDAPGFLSYTVRVGMRVPLAKTGSGMVLLAFQPEDKQKQWIAASAENVNNQQRTALLRRLKQVRRRGYEKRASQFVGGVTDLSAPVLDHTDCAVAAITVPYLAQSQHSRPVDVVLEEVVVAAGKLSQKLQASN